MKVPKASAVPHADVVLDEKISKISNFSKISSFCVVVLRPSASNLKLDLATNKFVVEKVHETITREKKAQKGKNHYILHIKNTLYPNSDL